jgi:hypothetical protein
MQVCASLLVVCTVQSLLCEGVFRGIVVRRFRACMSHGWTRRPGDDPGSRFRVPGVTAQSGCTVRVPGRQGHGGGRVQGQSAHVLGTTRVLLYSRGLSVQSARLPARRPPALHPAAHPPPPAGWPSRTGRQVLLLPSGVQTDLSVFGVGPYEAQVLLDAHERVPGDGDVGASGTSAS